MKKVLFSLIGLFALATAWAGEANYVFSDNYSSNTKLTDVTINLNDDVTFVATKPTGATDPQYYANGTAVRFYGNNTLTIAGATTDVTITSIKLYGSTSNSISKTNVSIEMGDGALSEMTDGVVWTGSADAVTLKNPATSGNIRFNKVDVVYTKGAPAPTYTHSVSFDNSEKQWGSVYAYVWKEDPKVENATWPGVLMTKAENSDVWTYGANLSFEPTNVIFTNGAGAQTADLTWTNEAEYPQTFTATFDNGLTGWENVYAHAYNGDVNNGQKLMENTSGTVWTWSEKLYFEPEYIIFYNGNWGEGNQTGDLAFTNGGAYGDPAPSKYNSTVVFANQGWEAMVNNKGTAYSKDAELVWKDANGLEYVTSAVLGEGGSGNTYPKYYSDGLRTYYSGRNIITVNAPEGYLIKAVEATMTSNNTIKFDGNEATATNNVAEYTFADAVSSFELSLTTNTTFTQFQFELVKVPVTYSVNYDNGKSAWSTVYVLAWDGAGNNTGFQAMKAPVVDPLDNMGPASTVWTWSADLTWEPTGILFANADNFEAEGLKKTEDLEFNNNGSYGQAADPIYGLTFVSLPDGYPLEEGVGSTGVDGKVTLSFTEWPGVHFVIMEIPQVLGAAQRAIYVENPTVLANGVATAVKEAEITEELYNNVFNLYMELPAEATGLAVDFELDLVNWTLTPSWTAPATPSTDSHVYMLYDFFEGDAYTDGETKYAYSDEDVVDGKLTFTVAEWPEDLMFVMAGIENMMKYIVWTSGEELANGVASEVATFTDEDIEDAMSEFMYLPATATGKAVTFVFDIENETLTASWAKDYEVGFQAYKWENVYAYVWNDDTKEVVAAWPGVKLEGDATGYYNYKFSTAIAPTHIIFNNGLEGDENKTKDLVFEDGNIYNNYPEKVYMFNTGENGNWNIATGHEAIGADGVYVWNNIEIKAAKDEAVGYLCFGLQPSDEWQFGTRFGSVDGNQRISFDNAMAVEEGNNCWYVGACYLAKVLLNLPTMTVSFEYGSTGIEGVAADADNDAVYYNLQGVRVENPAQGLYIVVRGEKVSKELVK